MALALAGAISFPRAATVVEVAPRQEQVQPAPKTETASAEPEEAESSRPGPRSSATAVASVNRSPGVVAAGMPARTTAPPPSSRAPQPLAASIGQAAAQRPNSPVYWALAVPNDPKGTQWYTTKIAAPGMWDLTTGTSETTVAVIDTGFALEHEDLIGRWRTNPGEEGYTVEEGQSPNCTSQGLPLNRSCNGLDDDRNGYIDDWRGWNYVSGDNLPQAGRTSPTAFYASHGTLVAGLVGATGGNGIGTASVNWRTSILPLQVLSDQGVGYSDAIAEAIYYSIARGVDVINLSLGSDASDSYLENAIKAAQAAGIPVVAAAGNTGCNDSTAAPGSAPCVLYPARYPSVIAVGATDQQDEVASFSASGPAVDIVAPGTGGLVTTSWSSTNGSSLYTSGVSGTSLSAPIVAGTVAILKGFERHVDPRVIAAELARTADKPAQMGGAHRTDGYGFGRLNVFQAAQSFRAPPHPQFRPEHSTRGDSFVTGSIAQRDAAAGSTAGEPYTTREVKDLTVFRAIRR